MQKENGNPKQAVGNKTNQSQENQDVDSIFQLLHEFRSTSNILTLSNGLSRLRNLQNLFQPNLFQPNLLQPNPIDWQPLQRIHHQMCHILHRVLCLPAQHLLCFGCIAAAHGDIRGAKQTAIDFHAIVPV